MGREQGVALGCIQAGSGRFPGCLERPEMHMPRGTLKRLEYQQISSLFKGFCYPDGLPEGACRR